MVVRGGEALLLTPCLFFSRVGVMGDAGSPCGVVRVGEWNDEDRRAEDRSRSREAIRIGERFEESEGEVLLLLTLNAFEQLLVCELPCTAAGAARNPAPLVLLLLLLSAAAAAAECLSLTGLFGGDGDTSL